MKRNSIKNICLQASLNKHKPGEFWKKLKPLLPSSNSSSDNSIHLIGDKLVTDPASVFNEYFCSPVIDQNVLKLTEDHFSSHSSVIEILNQGVNLNFSFAVINSEYLNDLLLTLDEKKSCGPDRISPKILKISTPAIAVPLTKLFNHCIDNSIWPTEWKHSNVIPAFKKDDPTSKTNYRPINLLSEIPKVFEKIMFDQLYLAFSPIFSENMSGFLRGHSCCTALLKLTEDWRSALDDKKNVAVVAIDLSKAFDSLCHNLLLAKLKSCGVGNSAIDLIRSYLHGRKQRVKCNNAFSDWLPVQCGVPQGSLLGPLLFNIYMNDISSLVTRASIRLYADDTTTYDSDQCSASLELSINTDIKVLDRWFCDNYLTVNAGKTQAMVMENEL